MSSISVYPESEVGCPEIDSILGQLKQFGTGVGCIGGQTQPCYTEVGCNLGQLQDRGTACVFI